MADSEWQDRHGAAGGFHVTGMDAVVFAVGNARQAAHYYSRLRHALRRLPRPGDGEPR